MASSPKICLVILDGWGIGRPDFSNPIHKAKTPALDKIKQHYPFLSLQASGVSVGLPYNTPGNSEVGHLTIGTGQILYQYSVRISQSIKNKSFFQNSVLKETCQHAKDNNSTLHLVGLLSDSVVHSSREHLQALLELAVSSGVNKINLHLFLDGQDSSPQSGKILLEQLQKNLQKIGKGKIVSLCGRFYAMDNNGHFDRTARCYENLVQESTKVTSDPVSYLQSSYSKDINDEFIIPIHIAPSNNTESLGVIRDNDAVIFFNFKGEKMQQLGEAFANPDFKQFPVKKFQNLKITTLTLYKESFPFAIAFPPQKITTSLAQVLSQKGKRQFHLSEAERTSHITYFFNGLKNKPFPGEHWVIVPALKTLHLEDYPQLNAPAITTRLAQAMEENIYDFILVNYANPDLIGHTGNLEAGIKCAEFIDKTVGKLVALSQEHHYTLIITADHGNLERMMDPLTGEIETSHDISLVPFYLIDPAYYSSSLRSEEEIKKREKQAGGMLADIAPTILELFQIPVPPNMIGQNLLLFL